MQSQNPAASALTAPPLRPYRPATDDVVWLRWTFATIFAVSLASIVLILVKSIGG